MDDIAANVKDGTYTLKPVSKRSELWKTFGLVLDADGEEIFGVACCFTCHTCLLYKKKEGGSVTDYGTKNLIGHKHHCRGSAGAGSTGIKACFATQRSALGNELPSTVKRAEAFFVNGTLSSFNIVQNEHFEQLCQVMIDIGAKKGKIAAKDVLYGRKTIQTVTLDLAEEVRNKIKAAVATPATTGAVSFVTDLWTDRVAQNSYLELTLFWVDESGDDGSVWKLRRAMFHCQCFNKQKTAENIIAEIDIALESASLNPRMVPVTTDKGANIVAATRQNIRVDCACHRLHTAVECAWTEAKRVAPALEELDEQCHRLVQYVKKLSGIQGQLEITLKQGGSTRPWRALIKMLESVLGNITDPQAKLASLLRGKRKEGYLSDIDVALLKQVHAVLAPATAVFDMWEIADIPAISCVVPGYYLLYSTWKAAADDDTPPIVALKSELVRFLDNKVWSSVIQIHFAGTFLDPSLKQFLFCDKEADRKMFRQQAIGCTKEFAKPVSAFTGSPEVLQQSSPQREPSTSATAGQAAKPPDPKQAKVDPLAAFRTARSSSAASSLDSEEDFDRQFSAELRRYEALDGPDVHGRFDALAWWGKERFRFPLLSTAARQVLVIQAASAESERHFSTGARVTRKDRARLSPETVGCQMILAEGLKKKIIEL